MPITPLTGGSITGMKSLYTAGAGTTEEEPGFLLSLALALDAPRNWAWGGTSKKRVTGWDALRKMGIRDKPGKFDPVDILAFGLEVVGDPLTYLGGLGGLTKAGKLASSLGKATGSRAASRAAIKTAMEGAEKFNVKQLLKATKEVEKGGELKKIMEGLELGVDAEGQAVKLTVGEATRFERGVTAVKRAHEAQTRTRKLQSQLNEMGASEILAKSWRAAAQGDLPQRKLLSLTIPFTDVEKVLIKGAPVLGAIQASGQLLGKFPPIAATGRLISNAFQRSDALQPYMHEYKLQARQIMREGVEKETALGKEADELFGLEQAHQIQATERYAQKEYGKSASELTAEEIQKRFDDTLQRSYVTADDYTKEQFFDDILTGREAYGMDPVILKRKKELEANIVVEVEKIRGASRKKWADELYRRLVGQRTRNKERAAILKERGRSLSTLKTPAIVQIEKRLSQLQGRFSERLDNLAVSAKKDIETEVDKLLGLRKELDEAEFGLAKQKVDRDTFQSALDEAVPGYRSVLNNEGTAFHRFEKIADDAKSLEDIAESRGMSVKDLKKEARENFRQLKKSKSNVERLKGNLSKAEGEIEAQIGEIEKKMGDKGAWSVPTDVTATITFAGYDTFGQAFSPGFLRPLVLIEKDPRVVEFLKTVHGEKIKPRDIVEASDDIVKDIKAAKLTDRNHIFHASPECTRCTPASKHKEFIEDDYFQAESIIKIIDEAEPPVVTIENSPNYMNPNFVYKRAGKEDYQPYFKIKEALEKKGYVVDTKIIDPADYGGAMSRPRMILRAAKKADLDELRDKAGDVFRDIPEEALVSDDALMAWIKSKPEKWRHEFVDEVNASVASEVGFRGMTTAYHGTSSAIGKQIREGGFAITEGQRGTFFGATEKVQNQAIFFSEDPNIARGFGANKAPGGYGDVDLISVKIDAKKILDADDWSSVPENIREYAMKKLNEYEGTSLRAPPKDSGAFYWLLDQEDIVKMIKDEGYDAVRFSESTGTLKELGAASKKPSIAVLDPTKIHIPENIGFGKTTGVNPTEFRAMAQRIRKLNIFDDVHPLPPKTGKPADWWQTIKDLAHKAPDDVKFTPAKNKDAAKIQRMIDDPDNPLIAPAADRPIIYMGGNVSRPTKTGGGGVRNAGTPDAPVPLPSLTRGRQKARILFSDGKGGFTAKEFTPEMQARLMGFGDELKLPDNMSPSNVKNVLGNGMHVLTTRVGIQSMLEQRIAGGIVPKIGKKSKFQTAATEGQRESLKARFRLREAELKKNLEVKRLEGEADMLRNELGPDDKILRQTADENALAAIPEFKEINANPLKGIDEALPKKVKGRLAKKLQDAVHDNNGMIQRLDENLADNDAYVSLLRPESQALVKHLDQEVGELLARRVAVGATKEGTVMAARLQSITKNYAERVLTTDARAWLLSRKATDGKGGTMLDMYHRNMGRYSKSAMSAKTGGDIPRLDRWREEFTSEVNKFFEKLPGDRPAQWFNKDFSVTYPGKYIGDERSVLNATFVTSLVNGKGIVKKILEKNAHDYVTLGDFYMEHGIHRVTVKGKEIVLGDSKAARKAMKDAGLLDKGIRNSLADEIRGVTVKLVDSDDMSHLGEIYDKMILGPLRWSLTRPWLPFHLRNFSTNIFLNWLGGVSNPKFYKQAARAVFSDQDEMKRLTDIGVLTGGWSREAAKELTDAGRIKIWSKMEKWFKNKYPKGSKRWEKYTSFAEDMGRAAHYYGKKADGLTDFEALESVNKYLLDYSDLTNFERRYGKRMFMFYNWTRKMIPMLTKEFISNPAKMAALTRGSVQPSLMRPEGLPEYIKASFALPLPWKDRKGREQFVTTFGSPIEEFRKFDVSQREGGLAGIGSELARTIIGQMTPPFKQAAEIAAGKDFFYRKPIQEADRVKQMFGLEKLLPGLRTDVLKSGKTRLRADPDMLYALRQSPFSRVISTLQKLGDPDRDLSDKLFATLSGINVARFYKETQAPRNMVDMLKRKLKLKIPEGMVRNFETIYATEAGKKNAEVMRLMEILRGAEKKSRAVYQTSGGKL